MRAAVLDLFRAGPGRMARPASVKLLADDRRSSAPGCPGPGRRWRSIAAMAALGVPGSRIAAKNPGRDRPTAVAYGLVSGPATAPEAGPGAAFSRPSAGLQPPRSPWRPTGVRRERPSSAALKRPVCRPGRFAWAWAVEAWPEAGRPGARPARFRPEGATTAHSIASAQELCAADLAFGSRDTKDPARRQGSGSARPPQAVQGLATVVRLGAEPGGDLAFRQAGAGQDASCNRGSPRAMAAWICSAARGGKVERGSLQARPGSVGLSWAWGNLSEGLRSTGIPDARRLTRRRLG